MDDMDDTVLRTDERKDENKSYEETPSPTPKLFILRSKPFIHSQNLSSITTSSTILTVAVEKTDYNAPWVPTRLNTPETVHQFYCWLAC